MDAARVLANTVGVYTPALIAVGLIYLIVQTVYRLYFHPLAKFPGPKIAATGILWHTFYWISGDWPHHLAKAHRKYGDVVRIGPNELSFASTSSWKEIYGHASKGRSTFLKSDFYDPREEPHLANARDPIEHSTQRRALSAAFSAKALRDQEAVIHQYVDMFMAQLGKLAGATTKGVDIPAAFNWLTFDIIGDLTFGESFDAVKDWKTHPWISVIVDSVFWTNIINMRNKVPLLNLVLPFFFNGDLAKRFAFHVQLTKEKTEKRVQQKDAFGREDFFKAILSKGDWDRGRLEANAEMFVVAGSETTATTLSGLMYFLTKYPHCIDQLRKEVTSAFTSYHDITADATSKLPYLHAVIEEGLRMYPPVSFGLPRVCPGAVVSDRWIPAGTIVSTHSWTTHRDPRYWHDAETFLPERWIGDGFGDCKEAFYPFSLGPRGCLGINLAYMELRIILSKLVWAYDWELIDKDVDWVRGNKLYLLWKKPEMKMRFYPRADVKA